MTTEPSSAPFDWEALARYLAGESPAEEAALVRRWLDAHPGDAALVRALDGTLDRLAIARTPSAIDVEDALRHVMERRDEADVVPLRPAHRAPAHHTSTPVRSRWTALRAAAIVAVAGALGWWATRHAAPDAGDATRSYATAVGRRDSVRLPDGSRVVLGPSSRLVVGAGYGDATREVSLEGEGWFDVVHDDTHTFTVHAAGATIRDVGTTFTVRTGQSESSARVRVAVQEGAVLLDATAGDAERGVVLHRGDVGVVLADGRLVARPGTATEDDVAWTRGRLVFREASLDEVRGVLRAWYGIELRADDPAIAARHLTASFDGDPPERVLQVIGLALGARVDRRGDTAVVRPAGGP